MVAELCSVFLLAWLKERGAGQPLNWTEAAQNRAQWRDVLQAWLASKNLPSTGQLWDPTKVDLLGRQVLQIGWRFQLLPMRHVPIEEAYDSPLRVVEIDEADHATPVVQIATDGSCRTGTGGFAAVLKAPYADIETAIVGRGRMPGESTNIMAEVRAAVLGLRMALQLHKSTGVEFFQLLTDSMFVVQAVEEDLTAGRHAATKDTVMASLKELFAGHWKQMQERFTAARETASEHFQKLQASNAEGNAVLKSHTQLLTAFRTKIQELEDVITGYRKHVDELGGHLQSMEERVAELQDGMSKALDRLEGLTELVQILRESQPPRPPYRAPPVPSGKGEAGVPLRIDSCCPQPVHPVVTCSVHSSPRHAQHDERGNG